MEMSRPSLATNLATPGSACEGAVRGRECCLQTYKQVISFSPFVFTVKSPRSSLCISVLILFVALRRCFRLPNARLGRNEMTVACEQHSKGVPLASLACVKSVKNSF